MESVPVPASSNELLFNPRHLRELVRGVTWLRELADDEVESLLEDSRVQSLASREWLFHQEAPALWLYIVIGGIVRLVRSVGDQRLATIRCVERGGPLGQLSMVSQDGAYLYSAQALRKTHVLAMPAARCRALLETHPACRAEFMSRLALELTERLEDMTLLTQADATARLVSYLIRQLPGEPGRGPRVVRLTIPKRWLAAQLAMTPETLSRLLGKLRDSGTIDIDRQRLVVRDEQKLRAMLMTGS